MRKTNEKNNKGITLVALVITIIVMLILVAVTITVAVNGGLFDYARNATSETREAIDAEQDLANGMINIGGFWYESIDDYLPGKAKNDVYAILYDDGTFVFNSTGEKMEDKTVVFESGNIGRIIFNESKELKWLAYVENIKTVIIEDLIKPYSTSFWFYNCVNLTEIQNIENLNTSFVTSMQSMFSGCSGLTSIDVSSFNTSNVTSMRRMFGATSEMLLNEIKGLSGFNTSKVEDMAGMFQNCTKLTSIDVSSFNTSNVTSMRLMFASGNNKKPMSLTEIKGLVGFNTSKVEDMVAMFQNCTKLTSIDVSSFDTSNVADMGFMFNNCNNLRCIFLPITFSKIQFTSSQRPFNNVKTGFIVYCEATTQLSGWKTGWFKRTATANCSVRYGYTKEQYDAL